MEAAKIPSGLNFPQQLEKVYGDADYELGQTEDSHGFLIEYSAKDSSILRIEGNRAMILKAGETEVYAKFSTSTSIQNTVPLVQYLTVRPGLLKLTASSNQSKEFGASDPDFEFQLSGLAYGEGQDVISGKLQRESGEDVGHYRLILGDLTAGTNYEVEFVPAEFEITKKKVTVEAQNASKYFGSSDPEMTFAVKGVNQENIAQIITGQPQREAGEKIGKYLIGTGDMTADANYELVFEEGIFEIIPVELSTVFEPSEIETAWSVMPDLPEAVSVLTKDGQILEVPVAWETSSLELHQNGPILISGDLEMSDGIENPDQIKATQSLTVLEKPAPKDIRLSQEFFEPGIATVEIGQFIVEDELDDIHLISLVEGHLDNSNFQVDGMSLLWKNATPGSVKENYSILVEVTDRAGNKLGKEFDLKTEISPINDIHVHNVFTPNQDGYNDTWGIPELGNTKGIQIAIFDKNGAMMFSTDDPQEYWDGTFGGKPVSSDTYFWVLSEKSTGESRKGFLTVIKN